MRNDIHPGYRVAQSVHAVAQYAIKHPLEFKNWNTVSNTVCCLECDPDKLLYLIQEMKMLGLEYVEFKEPDIGNQLTSIAICVDTKTHKLLFKNLKLTNYEN